MATSSTPEVGLIRNTEGLHNQNSAKAVVTIASPEFLQRREQTEVVKLFGFVDYDADYDFKAGRQRQN